MKTKEEAALEIREIFHEMLREEGIFSAHALAILTLATVFHMNSHPVYIVEADEDALAASPGK
jgi:Holliday junction resolvasome RuvABC DNA-binding subunit